MKYGIWMIPEAPSSWFMLSYGNSHPWLFERLFELLSIVVYDIIPDVSFGAMVMPPVPLPLHSLRR